MAQRKVKIVSMRENIERFDKEPLECLKRSVESKMSLSGWLESSTPRKRVEDQDAFSTICEYRGWRTRSDMRNGIYASHPSEFLQDDAGKVAVAEVLNRAVKAAQYRSTLHSSADAGPGDALRPYYEGMWQFDSDFEPQIPLHMLTRRTVPISGKDYRKPIIHNDPDAFTEKNVAEGANLPEVRIMNSERRVRLNKRGLLYRFSYDFLDTTDVLIDHVALLAMEVALRREAAKVDGFVDIALNGDGNENTAAHQHYASDIIIGGAQAADLPSGSTANLTPELILAFQKKFKNPYSATIFLMDEEMATEFQTLRFREQTVTYIELSQGLQQPNPFTAFHPMNQMGSTIYYGWLDSMPPNMILGIDKARGIEHVIQMGSDIMESGQNIENQTRLVTSSNTYAFAIYQQDALRCLNMNTKAQWDARNTG